MPCQILYQPFPHHEANRQSAVMVRLHRQSPDGHQISHQQNAGLTSQRDAGGYRAFLKSTS